jgi:hypothetical protein
MATFLPGGTVKVMFFRIGTPLPYEKLTLSNLISGAGLYSCSGAAPGSYERGTGITINLIAV